MILVVDTLAVNSIWFMTKLLHFPVDKIITVMPSALLHVWNILGLNQPRGPLCLLRFFVSLLSLSKQVMVYIVSSDRPRLLRVMFFPCDHSEVILPLNTVQSWHLLKHHEINNWFVLVLWVILILICCLCLYFKLWKLQLLFHFTVSPCHL
jgi:hypothetical protein